MAKTTGPLFSVGAHGSLSKTLNYSRRRSGEQCRKYNKPTGVPTAKQRAQRRLTEFLVAQWQNMSAGDKATWAANARGTGLNLSGYHYFLRSAQKDLYTHHGLCGYWHCNEIIGGKVLDLSGNANHGTLSPGYPADAPTPTPSISTRFSNALLYDGSNDYVDCGNKENLNIRGDISVVIWAKPNAISDGKGWVTKGAYQSNGWYVEQGYTDSNLQIRFSQSGSIRTVHSVNFLEVGKVYQAVLVKDGTIGRIFINGVDRTAATDTLFTPDSSSLNLWIGDHVQGGPSFAGLLDEICVYKRALSAAEIRTRYKFAVRNV